MSGNLWHPFAQMKTFIPFKVKRADGLFLELEDGRKVMDFVSSWWVNIHGHGNRIIAKAIYEQAKILEHVLFADFSHDPAEKLVNSLKTHLPSNLKHFFFSDDGSTAVEVALKMAYQYWKNRGENNRTTFLCFEGGYHGDTFGSMAVSSLSPFTAPFSDLFFKVKRIPFPETYEGDSEIEVKEAFALDKLKTLCQSECAAIIVEPLIQGAGGMRICRPQFLKKVETLVKDMGIITIYDEVMTGFGRTGELFACCKTGIAPDIICLSKGLTGGFLPLGLSVASDAIYESFVSDDRRKTFFHGHSYTASPLGCAAAIASLKLLEKTASYKDIDHSNFIRTFIGSPKVEKVRSVGTIAAFDIKEAGSGYFSDAGRRVKEGCFKRGLFLRPLGNTIYFMPPYCVKEEELLSAIAILKEVLDLL